MKKALVFTSIVLCFVGSVLSAETIKLSSSTFSIPTRKPDIVITSNSMTIKDGVATLNGNVRATRKYDLLTCNKAIVNNDPKWVLASFSPRLYRKEPILEKKLTREVFLDARNIFYNADTGKFNASNSVNLKIEEKTWDLATFTWVIISSDAMAGFKNSNRLLFSGNVKIKDKDHFGKGNRLEYLKDSSTAILTGNAYVETQEWNSKKKKFEKKILTGQKIIYNTETKEATSE